MTGWLLSAGRSSVGRRTAAATISAPERGDHGAVVGAQPRARHPHAGRRRRRRRVSAMRAAGSSRRPRRRSAGRRRRGRGAASQRLADQHVADRLLERRRDVGDRHRLAGPLARLDPARHGGLRARRRRSRTGAAPGRAGWSARAGSRWPTGARRGPPRSMCGPPGNGSPSSRATLSNASPAASSMVAPSGSTSVVTSSTRSSDECPPLTSSARHGLGQRAVLELVDGDVRGEVVDAVERLAETRCASALAAATPTSRAPASPGPRSRRSRRRRASAIPAVSQARSRVGTIASRWARLATSGTTPPNRACSSTLLGDGVGQQRLARGRCPTPVSSHEVSMPEDQGSRSRSHPHIASQDDRGRRRRGSSAAPVDLARSRGRRRTPARPRCPRAPPAASGRRPPSRPAPTPGEQSRRPAASPVLGATAIRWSSATRRPRWRPRARRPRPSCLDHQVVDGRQPAGQPSSTRPLRPGVGAEVSASSAAIGVDVGRHRGPDGHETPLRARGRRGVRPAEVERLGVESSARSSAMTRGPASRRSAGPVRGARERVRVEHGALPHHRPVGGDVGRPRHVRAVERARRSRRTTRGRPPCAGRRSPPRSRRRPRRCPPPRRRARRGCTTP